MKLVSLILIAVLLLRSNLFLFTEKIQNSLEKNDSTIHVTGKETIHSALVLYRYIYRAIFFVNSSQCHILFQDQQHFSQLNIFIF